MGVHRRQSRGGRHRPLGHHQQPQPHRHGQSGLQSDRVGRGAAAVRSARRAVLPGETAVLPRRHRAVHHAQQPDLHSAGGAAGRGGQADRQGVRHRHRHAVRGGRSRRLPHPRPPDLQHSPASAGRRAPTRGSAWSTPTGSRAATTTGCSAPTRGWCSAGSTPSSFRPPAAGLESAVPPSPPRSGRRASFATVAPSGWTPASTRATSSSAPPAASIRGPAWYASTSVPARRSTGGRARSWRAPPSTSTSTGAGVTTSSCGATACSTSSSTSTSTRP